ncbi:BamA/TamA family outer membrane protein [Mucilaginibacter jinjuensis]|uniref:BamA/TamA family outer membrane protein n=1 Tax=Mucilaginibacter jinjuensis TaxID=1176721 RepID=A0ABY7TBI8_9SPHI|nr:BamA/TamA family outer membrane protein [Mucilaginibacter jinjuensis]WCT13880.1 BamA/TamA family outer membrane protein [Mucilaginibacter jinjuensis]
MLKRLLFILCLFPASLFAQDASGVLPQKTAPKDTADQVDLIDIGKKVFHIHPSTVKQEEGKKLYFSILPTSSNVPGGGGKALVTSTTAGFYLGPRKTTYLSSVNFAPYWNLGSRFGLPLRSNIWLADNKWLIQGDMRFLVYPQYTWGLGSTNNNDQKVLLDYNYIRFYQAALKQIKPYLFAGIGYDLDYYFNIKADDPATTTQQFTGYKYGTSNSSFSSGLSFNLLYDTRNNSLNPLPGAYANIVYRVNPTFMGSNENWHSIYIDFRKYLSMNPTRPTQQNTLAFWSYFWSVLGSHAPYLNLPSIGWDPYNRSGEGIEQNRYRGRSLFYLESEYRRDITRNGLLGFVVFANATTVSGSDNLFTSWHPAAGTGLRVKFNKGSNTNIGMDYGFSKGYSAIIFNIGESF